MNYHRITAGVLAAVLLLAGAKPPAAAEKLPNEIYGRTAMPSFLEVLEALLEEARRRDVLPLRREEAIHMKFMDGNDLGMFEPSKNLTRAEAAQILFRLLEEPSEAKKNFSDVPAEAWYAPAVRTLAAMGVMRGDPEGCFRPEEPFTRKECAAAAACFLLKGNLPLQLEDVPMEDPDYNAVCTVIVNGIFGMPEDGCFRPEEPLTRAEAAAVFNRLLGREPDDDTIQTSPQVRFFPDVPENHWAYAYIMEATISHQQEAGETAEHWLSMTEERNPLPDGFHNINGWLYCTQDGKFVRSSTVDGFSFGADGYLTTGNTALDAELSAIVRTKTNDSMSQDEKLRALYAYVRDQFTYIKRDLISQGQSGWEPAYAEAFLHDGRGNCFGYAATFCLLARELGYDAHTVVGWLGQNRQPHGWVEISLDGTTYLYDAELEMKYRSSNFFQARYGNTLFSYYK